MTDVSHEEYLAQTRLDEAVYSLMKLGWSSKAVLKKVDDLVDQYEGVSSESSDNE